MSTSAAALPSDYIVMGHGLSGSDMTGCFWATFPLAPTLASPVKPILHGLNFNVVFCDAHVAALPFTNVFNPTKTARHWNVDNQEHAEVWERFWHGP
jgi:prepilin-type processing-associated H-X9-DG protein